MAKFNFKLQNILNMKLQMEEMHKNDLSKATKKYMEQKEVINTIEASIRESLREMKEAESDEIRIHDIISYRLYIENLKEKKVQEIKKLKKCENEMEICRNKLVQAVKERKMFESLREKEFDNFKIEIQKADDKVMDEIVSFKFSE